MQSDLAQSFRGAAGVFNRMREGIVAGEYYYNQRLPSERDLAEQFCVARGTVRSALQQLERAGLTKRKFCSGAFVRYNRQLNSEDIAKKTSPLELIETRLAIEPHVVRMVVAHADNRDLKKLQCALDDVIACETDPHAYAAADEMFHLVLAHCSHNPLLIWMYQRLNDIREHKKWRKRAGRLLTAEKTAAYNRQHNEVVQQIVRRDAEGAAQAMWEHLNQAKQDLLDTY